jgi:hypothetical protein
LWHFLLGVPIIPAVICIFTLAVFCPESPRALVTKTNGQERAHECLVKLRNTDHVNAELSQLVSEDDGSGGQAMSLFQLFLSKECRMPLFVGLVLQLTQQFCGINAVCFIFF